MGQLDVHIRHSGGGPGIADLLPLAVLAGVAIGLAVIIIQFAWLILSGAAAAVAARLYLLHRAAVDSRVIAAAFAREHEIRRQEKAAALAAERQHELAVAAAGATVIQNIIDPRAIAAALGVQPQPQPWPQPARVIRGEVER